MDWDWNAITTGEWWVVVIALVSLLVGWAVGYTMGRSKERKEWEAKTMDSPAPRNTWGH